MQDAPYPGVTRKRSVAAFNGFPALVVYDRVDQPSLRRASALWHLSRGMHVEITGHTSVRATAGKGDTTLTIVQVPLEDHRVPRDAIAVVTGRRRPPLGWYAPDVDKWYPAPVVTTSRTSHHVRMLTVLVGTAASEHPRVTSTRASDGWYRVRIRADGRTRTVRVSPGGYLSL